MSSFDIGLKQSLEVQLIVRWTFIGKNILATSFIWMYSKDNMCLMALDMCKGKFFVVNELRKAYKGSYYGGILSFNKTYSLRAYGQL